MLAGVEVNRKLGGLYGWRRLALVVDERFNLAGDAIEHIVQRCNSLAVCKLDVLIAVTCARWGPSEEAGTIEIGVDQRTGLADQFLDVVLPRLEPCRSQEVSLRWLATTPHIPMSDLSLLLATIQLEVGGSELELLATI